MRLLLTTLLLLAAAWAQGQDAVPTIRSALEAADAATAEDIPVERAGVDEREATLRELEFRIDRMRSAREQMQIALTNMVADPRVDPNIKQIACKAAVPTMRAPDFIKLLRGKVKWLEKPKNFAQLTPEQVERLTGLKAGIESLQTAPDMDCSKT